MTLTKENIEELIRVIRLGQMSGITECDDKGNEKKFMWELKITQLK